MARPCTFTVGNQTLKGHEQIKAWLVDNVQTLYKDGVLPWEQVDAKTNTQSLLDAHAEIEKRIDTGKITADEMRAEFENLVSNSDAIMAELSKLTKAELEKRIHSYIRPDAKKADLVKSAYGSMITDYWISDEMFSFSHSFGSNETTEQLKAKKIRQHLESLTDADIQKHADDIAKAQKEREEQRKQVLEGMENPQTLDDYSRVMRERMSDGETTFGEARMQFTPEQRAQFDEMLGEKTRGDRKARADQQKDIRATVTTTEGDIIETKHTKTGEALFVVKAADRVDRETYNQWNATAKRLGGYYSSYRGNGAVPGFTFKTKENAEAFLQYLGGNIDQAKQVAQERRDVYADNKSQTAVERLNEMADRLEEKGEESLNRGRKTNTAKRAGEAARAEAAAHYDISMAKTMRNIAKAIESGTAKFLDRVRQKVQVEMLQNFVHNAQGDKLRKLYPNYADELKHKGEAPNVETADYAQFPAYTAYRSDLANLARQLLENEGTKRLGQQLMKVADDTSKEYEKFAKDNVLQVAAFYNQNTGERAVLNSKKVAEEIIYRSNFGGKAIPIKFKEGWRIVLSPSEAIKRGAWSGDNDKRITLSKEFGAELIEKLGKINRYKEKVRIPWQFENAYEKQKRLAAMGIETPAELRAALREFINLREAPKEADKIKEMERAMIGRANDGLDFFPTPASLADQMVETADIQEGMSVLEPSAGMGHIAERIRAAGVEPDVVELSSKRRELLEAKGFNVVGQDFNEFEGQYDRIIMNPPFSDRRDMAHVQHAYDMLKPGGRLVAIMGEGVFFGNDKKAQAFRDWLEERGGTDEKLEEGTFKDSSLPATTGVNARMIVIDKPVTEQSKYSKSPKTTGSTVEEVISWLPKKAKKLFDSGDLVILQSDGSSDTEGFFDLYKDKIYLIADNINKYTIHSVLAHELFHRAEYHDPIVTKANGKFEKVIAIKLKQAEKGIGTKEEIEAYNRVKSADVTGDKRLEEFGAYIVSAYMKKTDSVSGIVRKAIQDFIAAIRAFLVRNGLDMGYIKSLTAADLAAMSKFGARVQSDSVFNNNEQGEKMNTASADIRYSKADHLADLKRAAGLGPKKTLSDSINDIIKNGVKGNIQVIKDKWQELKPQLEQGLFDKFIGIKRAEREILGEVASSVSGYVGARLSTGSSSTMAAVIQFGSPVWRDGVVSYKDGTKGFADMLKPVKDDLENFTAYMVAKRAERLRSEGRENLFTPEMIKAGLALENDTFKQVAKDIAGLNKDILDFAQASGLIDPESRKVWESDDYIPFYRIVEGMAKAPRSKGGLSHQSSGIRMLKGGENPLSDPLGNMMMNWAHLIDASMKNEALNKTLKNLEGSRFVDSVPRVEFKQALIPKSQIKNLMLESGLPKQVVDAMPDELTDGIAKMWAMQAPTDPDIVRVMRDGKTEYYRINDAMLLTSLTAVNQSPLGGIFKQLRAFKSLLTSAVTADPTFMARNFIRDSMHSWTIAEEKGFKLGIDSIHGAVKTFKEEGGFIDMMFAGASFQGGYGGYNNPDTARKTMDSYLRKKGIKDIRGFKDSILDTPKKYFEMYRAFGDAIENASREAILENAKRAGKEKAEYIYEAKDLMDFSLQGSFAIVRALSDMLPFFNARLQGLYRLGRAGKTKEATQLILMKGATMAALSLALLALNSDNDDYEALEDWDKDQYWHFFVGNKHFRLPKPFELGLVFGTIPERSARALFGIDTPKEFAARMGHAASDTLAFNPIPQAFRPLVELYANTDMFTNRPIENMADEGKLPSARYNEQTSETMRKLSEWLPESLGASPKRLEHLVHGYTGAMGMYVLGASDMLVRNLAGMPEEPSRRLDNLPVIKAFYQEKPQTHTKYGTEFYEMLREVEQVYRTINAYKKEGRLDKAQELAIENADKLQARKSLTATNKRLSEIRKQIDSIYRSNMSADEKRIRIDKAMSQTNELVRKVVERTHPYFKK